MVCGRSLAVARHTCGRAGKDFSFVSDDADGIGLILLSGLGKAPQQEQVLSKKESAAVFTDGKTFNLWVEEG